MTAHPTLAEELKRIMEANNISLNKACELIGTTSGTLKKFLGGGTVQDGVMKKIRAFTENPAAAQKKQSKPAKKPAGETAGVSLTDLEFLMEVDGSDIEFVIGVMKAMDQESLSVDKMRELIKLKKPSESEE